jgi:GH24 family phage-related lysozyme (muramidase)
MPRIKLVDAARRTQWETFTVQDNFKTEFLINPDVATVSQEMAAVILGFREWRATRYVDVDTGKIKIGYGPGDPDLEQGMIEAEAYADFVAEIRQKQYAVRSQVPVNYITQSVFDALVSLYVDTGSWRVVQADEGTYDLQDAIRNGNWLLAADILMRGNQNPDLRRAEARVLRLADYRPNRTRVQQQIQGIQKMRINYVSGAFDAFQRKQAEFAYYRQLGAFLPTMSEVKKRRVAAQSSPRTNGTESIYWGDPYGNSTGDEPTV